MRLSSHYVSRAVLRLLCRNPPEPLVKGHRPKALSFPEDPLIQSYMARHPEAKLVPISLSGDQPAPARAFAWRQLQLMQARHRVWDEGNLTGYQPAPRQLQIMHPRQPG